MDNLRMLPKIRDSISYVYIEKARIDRHHKSIAVWDETSGGYTPIPAAKLCVLMLGPGTTVTQAAIQALADNNCLVVWCGEENVRFYAFGTGGTRSAAPLLLQARLHCDEKAHTEVVKRMYRMRFDEWPDDAEHLTIEQLRGMEGARMRAVYADASRRSGVAWDGRNYDRKDWAAASAVNRALSAANQCLYGLSHAALLATGYSPGLGFIHTGKQLSFVYDIADLYKAEISIPAAFEVAGEARFDPELNVERAARLRCRDKFRQTKFLQRIVDDIKKIFGGKDLPTADDLSPGTDTPDFDGDMALPSTLWGPQSEGGPVHGGTSYGDDSADPDDEDTEYDGSDTSSDTNADDTIPLQSAPFPVARASKPPRNAASIEDLFRPPQTPAPKPHAAKPPTKNVDKEQVIDGPAVAPPKPAVDDGPFGADDGCEVPLWGVGPSPWEHLDQIAGLPRTHTAARDAPPVPSSEPPQLAAESGKPEES